MVGIVKNDSHVLCYKRTPSNFLVDRTYWTFAFRMNVSVSTVAAGLPKRRICAKVESFYFRNIWLILFILLKKFFLSSANNVQCRMEWEKN